MDLSSFAFETEVIVSVMVKKNPSSDSMRDLGGQMLKCHSCYVPQQEQVLAGLLVNGVGVLGGEEVAVRPSA